MTHFIVIYSKGKSNLHWRSKLLITIWLRHNIVTSEGRYGCLRIFICQKKGLPLHPPFVNRMKRTFLFIVLLMLALLTWAQQHVPDTLGLGVEAETWFTRSEQTDKSWRLGLIYNHKAFDIYGSLMFDDPLHVEEGSVEHTVQGDTLWQHRYTTHRTWGADGYTGKIGMNYHLRPNHQVGVVYSLIHTPTSDDHGTRRGSVRMNDVPKLNLAEDLTWNNGNVMAQQLNAYYRGQVEKTSIALDAEYYSHKLNVNAVINADVGDGPSESSSDFRHKRSHVLALSLDLDHALEHGSLNWGVSYLHTRRFDHYQPTHHRTIDGPQQVYPSSLYPLFETHAENGDVAADHWLAIRCREARCVLVAFIGADKNDGRG